MIGLVDGNNFFVSCERVFNRHLVGRPVAVLSNNDGCCVSRSNEFKALGIPMGTPYFKLREREESGELAFYSSNYELYGDISRRIVSILRDEAFDVEQYSIDEAFIYPPTSAAEDYDAYGRRLRAKLLRWVGIPCGIGFARTKTLAKIANHIGKKRPDGVFTMPDDPTDILASLPSNEVWGVGRRLPAKLRAMRIVTARHLRDAPDDTLRAIGGVALLRTAMELRGIPCHDERDYDAVPDSVSCSRSFGTPATTIEALEESLASFASQAAAKLRRHGLLASGCNIYAQTFASGGGGEVLGRTIAFNRPTDATNEIIRAFHGEVAALFIPGIRYRKTGIVFFGLEKPCEPRQQELFPAPPPTFGDAPSEPSRLYKAIDSINARFGRGKVFSAAEGVGQRPWQMKSAKLSKRASTRWDELPIVH
ncbi:MAG: Y-family DNA polymerase [Kiritimatiellae bacterium]|nr:Y-family DNA polymerase [Kiritimatiellia bacterium]